MANKPKIGLDYFPMEVNMSDDIKIRKLIRYQSGKSLSVYTQLLCIIYSNGYYIKWDDELPFVISEKLGYEEGYISEVIKCCLTIGLLSKQMYDQHQVLTSSGIQTRYELICKLLKRKSIVSEYNIINSEELPNNGEDMPQRKGNESKENETKGEEKPPPELNEFLSLVECKAQYLKIQQSAIDQICISKNLPREKISFWLDEFHKQLVTEGTDRKIYHDYVKHFARWINLKDVTKPIKNINSKANHNEEL